MIVINQQMDPKSDTVTITPPSHTH